MVRAEGMQGPSQSAWWLGDIFVSDEMHDDEGREGALSQPLTPLWHSDRVDYRDSSSGSGCGTTTG